MSPNWPAVYEYAIRNVSPLSGTYHDNYLIQDPPMGPCVVRMPKTRLWPEVEPRMFGEAAVLEAVAKAKVPCPRLLYCSADPAFEVHSLMPGQPVSVVVPAAGPVPAMVTTAVSDLMRSLSQVPVNIRPAPLPGQPWADVADTDTAGFASALVTWLSGIYTGASDAARGFLAEVGIWTDPFLEVKKHFRPSTRPFRLCHGDLGRHNILIDSEGPVSFIDWELAVWGDPLWDIAAHLHRMSYPSTQNKYVRQDLLATCRGFTGLNSQYDELRTFFYIERCRSLVLDAIRDLQAISSGRMQNIAPAAAEYAAKLSQASVTSASAASIKALYEKYGSRSNLDQTARLQEAPCRRILSSSTGTAVSTAVPPST